MKVCKLIRTHSFKDIRVFEKEAISLKKLGYEVTIVAGKRHGKLFGPDRKPISDTNFQKDAFVYKEVNFLTYNLAGGINQTSVNRMINSLKNNTQNYFIDKLYEKALSTNADIYHAHELYTLYDAVQIKRFFKKREKNVKVIFDAHELEGDSQLLKLLMKEVDHLITVSDSIKEIYQKRYPGIPITVIYNSPFYQKELIKDNTFNNSFVIAYEGAVTYEKGDPKRIIEISNICKAKMANFRFEIFGFVIKAPKEQKVINANPLIGCKWVDYKNLPKEFNKVHVGYIYFDISVHNRKYAMPNKFFSYLNNGVPVVVNAATDMKRFVEKYECGIVINKANPTAEDYFKAFYRLYQDRVLLDKMSKNARKVMKEIYCWEKMEERLSKVYNSLK